MEDLFTDFNTDYYLKIKRNSEDRRTALTKHYTEGVPKTSRNIIFGKKCTATGVERWIRLA